VPIATPRILIIVRAGRDSIHRSWLWTITDLADVGLSIFDDDEPSEDGVKFVHHCAGGKFQGLAAFFEAFPNVIDEYDYFWLFEDDLVLPFESLLEILSLLSKFPFELAAPALSYYSFFTWPITVRNSQFIFRCTNFVEVMAPIMSRAFLRRAMPAFRDNYSAWGHEWFWHKLLGESDSFSAIIDSAPITHSRPFGRGSLYKNRPAEGWTPEMDQERMLNKYGLEKNVQFRNYFGVTNDRANRVLVHDEFVEHALGGYAEMEFYQKDNRRRCLEALIQDARPVTTLGDLQEMSGFRMIEEALRKLRPLGSYGDAITVD
jgi:hypothetical protein